MTRLPDNGNESRPVNGRRRFIVTSVAGAVAGLSIPGLPALAGRQPDPTPDLANLLKSAGVPEAARSIGMDSEKIFGPLGESSHHNYRNYRWSVSFAAGGGPLIQALPPEEETGWTPWEEWYSIDGRPVRRAMVLFPVKEMTRNVPNWWVLEESSTDLQPRFARVPKTLGELFLRGRIFEAAAAVGFDARKVIIDKLTPAAEKAYLSMRWSVAPHRLAADLPVIQCLPSPGMSDRLPWETWYTDGRTPLIHHVHYTKPAPLTEKLPWRERDGAPQRPAELFGREWYYYNDDSMNPALADIKEVIR
jgi:hypothetical protein